MSSDCTCLWSAFSYLQLRHADETIEEAITWSVTAKLGLHRLPPSVGFKNPFVDLPLQPTPSPPNPLRLQLNFGVGGYRLLIALNGALIVIRHRNGINKGFGFLCFSNQEEPKKPLIHSMVYDVTPFMEDHPGGDEFLLAATGKDATNDYEDVGHSEDARGIMHKPESMHDYNLTPYSLHAAVSVGVETETIIAVLKRLSLGEIEGTHQDVLSETQLAAAAEEKEAHSFEIDHSQVENVKQRCLPNALNYPMLEEYDFWNHTINPDLEMELKPQAQRRPYEDKSLTKMFGNGRARSGIIVLPCGAGKSLVWINGLFNSNYGQTFVMNIYVALHPIAKNDVVEMLELLSPIIM
ncbi:hypothetical protein L2E82_14493 [Cichorium intybus]|uniref:Uncharacterized protein n=1 Tax=Cichorium intybus TaxID=13427 RepID=A0ACB9EZK4_CICIN|nr:hypothetical protein L2E82_14493 [Cichorium intybus]